MKPNLVILGGGNLNVCSIKDLKEYFNAIVVDANPKAAGLEIADIAVNIDIKDAEAIYNFVKDFDIAGIISMAEVGIRTKAILDKKLDIHQKLPWEVAINVTSKASMRKCWESIPKYNIPYLVIEKITENLETILDSLGGFPLICKPDESFGGSRGVRKVNNLQELYEAIEMASKESFNKKVVVEKYFTGREFSCEVLVSKGEISILAIGEKIKSKEPYRVDMSVRYSAYLSEIQFKEVFIAISEAIKSLGIENGVAHVEFCITLSNEIKLFELGARCGGGHTPQIAKHVSGIDEIVEYAKISCGLFPIQIHPLYQKGAEYRFFTLLGGKVKNIIFPDIILRDPYVFDFVLNVKKGDVISTLKDTSGRGGALVTIGENQKEAIEAADKYIDSFVVEYEEGYTCKPLQL